jgi:Zn-dependent protease
MPAMNEIIQAFTVWAIPVLLAITLHEAAHGYTAKQFGDLTAYSQGRITLNPFKHIDPVGTVLIPIILYIATKGTFLFGYAKPVPVTISHLRNPKRDMLWVAAAGPGANLVMGIGWALLIAICTAMGVTESYVFQVGRAGVIINLIMMAFNLFPLPPLDGGRIVTSLLPMNLAIPYSRIEPYGFFIVLALVITGAMDFWMKPVLALGFAIINWIV